MDWLYSEESRKQKAESRRQKAESRRQKAENRKMLEPFRKMNRVCLLPTAYCLLPTAYCLLPTAYFLLCQTFFFALFLRRLVPERRGSFFGSPVAAFATTPPSSSAISASVRFVKTEYGCVSVMSLSSSAYSSLCLIKSHCRSRVRTSTN